MKKILSFVVDGKNVIVTGDSSRNQLLPDGDKKFEIDQPYSINMLTPEGRTDFFQKLLQQNHKYTLNSDEITIDGILYKIGTYELKSKKRHFFTSHHPVNLFREYKEFLSFHVDELILLDLDDAVENLLNKFGIEKGVSEIVKTVEGFEIYVMNYSYYDQKYLNFKLLISPNRKVKFLHFFEQEGESYCSGNVPLTRNDIENEIQSQQKLLEEFDFLTKLFDITI